MNDELTSGQSQGNTNLAEKKTDSLKKTITQIMYNILNFTLEIQNID